MFPDDLLKLVQTIGDDRVKQLVDPKNASKVQSFCDLLSKAKTDKLPDTIIVDQHEFLLIQCLKSGESFINIDKLRERAKYHNANIGKAEGIYFLKHKDFIPKQLRNKVVFIFPKWHSDVDQQSVTIIYWSGFDWVKSSNPKIDNQYIFDEFDYLLSPISY